MTHMTKALSAAGFVDAGILPSFASPVTAQTRSDMLDSTLLAQLAADKQFSRLDRPGDWYDFYVATLGKLAWQISSFRREAYIPPGELFTSREVVLSRLAGEVAERELELVAETIRVFSDLPESDPRAAVYNKFDRSPHAVDLQVGVADASSALTTVGVVFETAQEVGRLFDEELAVSCLAGKIETLLLKARLNEALYAGLRESVIAKLGARRKELILDLDLPSARSR